MRLTTQHPLQFLGQRDATAHDNHVDIVGRTLEEDIPYIASHHITFHPEAIRRLTDLMEQLLV